MSDASIDCVRDVIKFYANWAPASAGAQLFLENANPTKIRSSALP
jgi:hypothetical protein